MIINKIHDATLEDLHQKVDVREKITGHRLTFKQDRFGNLKFYGKKSNKPLTIIDRFMSDLYEYPIRHIIKHSKNAYLHENKTYRIYLQENNKIILTDIEEAGEIYTDTATLKPVALSLNIDYQTSIFDGQFDSTQIAAIQSGLEHDELVYELFGSKFKTNGLIFKFDNGRVFKSVRHIIKTYPKHDTTVFEMAALDIISYISETENITDIKIHEANNVDIRFIDFSLRLFNKYINERNPDIPQWPQFLHNAGKINRKYLTYDPVFVYINKNNDKEYLLRIFMLIMTGRIKSRGLITKDDELTSTLIHSFVRDYTQARGMISFDGLKNLLK